ncbi:MAG: HlyD family efflux transporter periplasmic adaptor subunit [Legionellaceae bacterium]|nr:HlyD family efflux transporter periplasmic adaptor subunit [Legionellaceae bacterium]
MKTQSPTRNGFSNGSIVTVNDENTKKVHLRREINGVDDSLQGNPKEQEDKQKILSRFLQPRLLTSILYVIFGGLIFFSFIIIFNTYILRLKVEAAVVSTEIETMVAPMGGYITNVYVSAGELVKKGHPLLKIENIDLIRELELARLQVDESKLNIRYYQQLLDNEQERLNLYKNVGHSRVISARSLVNISKQNVQAAHHNFERYNTLFQKHHISAASLEIEHNKYINAKEELKNAHAEQLLQKKALKAIDHGMYFTGNKTEGIQHDLGAKLEAAQKQELLNRNRVKIYEYLINRLTLKAPFDGKITQILKSEGNTTDNIKPIVFIEKTATHKNIIAYLTQNEVIHIGHSKVVKIYIPSSGKTYRGNILRINRTEGFIDMVRAQYQSRDFLVDRSAMVTISIQDNDSKKFDMHAFSGMPVVVYFSKKSVLF